MSNSKEVLYLDPKGGIAGAQDVVTHPGMDTKMAVALVYRLADAVKRNPDKIWRVVRGSGSCNFSIQSCEHLPGFLKSAYLGKIVLVETFFSGILVYSMGAAGKVGLSKKLAYYYKNFNSFVDGVTSGEDLTGSLSCSFFLKDGFRYQHLVTLEDLTSDIIGSREVLVIQKVGTVQDNKLGTPPRNSTCLVPISSHDEEPPRANALFDILEGGKTTDGNARVGPPDHFCQSNLIKCLVARTDSTVSVYNAHGSISKGDLDPKKIALGILKMLNSHQHDTHKDSTYWSATISAMGLEISRMSEPGDLELRREFSKFKFLSLKNYVRKLWSSSKCQHFETCLEILNYQRRVNNSLVLGLNGGAVKVLNCDDKLKNVLLAGGILDVQTLRSEVVEIISNQPYGLSEPPTSCYFKFQGSNVLLTSVPLLRALAPFEVSDDIVYTLGINNLVPNDVRRVDAHDTMVKLKGPNGFKSIRKLSLECPMGVKQLFSLVHPATPVRLVEISGMANNLLPDMVNGFPVRDASPRSLAENLVSGSRDSLLTRGPLMDCLLYISELTKLSDSLKHLSGPKTLDQMKTSINRYYQSNYRRK